MSALRLYELSEQHRELETLLDSGEVPEEVVRDTLDALVGDIEQKSVSVAHAILNLDSLADQMRQAAKAMSARAQRVERRADAIRHYLQFHMTCAGIRKIEAPEFTLAIRTNPPALFIRDDADIPADFMVQPEPPPPRPDKKRLADAIKAGMQVDGVWLEQGERLEIKV